MKRLLTLLLLLPALANAQFAGMWNSPAHYNAASVAITGGTITGITDLAVADGGTGASTAREAAANLGVAYVACHSAVAVSGAADLNENTLYTCTVPANALGPNGTIRFDTTLNMTNSAANKTVRVRYSGAAGTILFTPIYTTNGPARISGSISNRNATNSQISSIVDQRNSSGVHTTATAVIDTTASTTLLITCQKATAGEACTLERILVELIYGAFLSLDSFAPESLRNAVAANDARYAYGAAA